MYRECLLEVCFTGLIGDVNDAKGIHTKLILIILINYSVLKICGVSVKSKNCCLI